MGRDTHSRLVAVIDDLYAGTLDDIAWDRALRGVADLVRGSAAPVFIVDSLNIRVLRDEQHGMDPHVLEAYRRYWLARDCRIPHFIRMPVFEPMTEWMTPLQRWERTAIFNEFLLPADVPYFMPAWLHKSQTAGVAVSLQAGRKRGPFGAEDIETFKAVIPHISRALRIRDRLEQSRVRADVLARQLDTFSVGVLILNSVGKVLEANRKARELFRRERGIGLRLDGTLMLREPAGARLGRWLSTGIPPEDGAQGLLHVSGPDGRSLSVTMARVRVAAPSWFGADPRWVLLIFDPDGGVRIQAELIEKDLGISPREAEVSALIVSGYTLRMVARRLRVSEHTTRSQLKSIFRKTGIRSQSELIRRVALGPAVRALEEAPGGTSS